MDVGQEVHKGQWVLFHCKTLITAETLNRFAPLDPFETLVRPTTPSQKNVFFNA